MNSRHPAETECVRSACSHVDDRACDCAEFDAVCFDDSIVPGAGTVTLVKTQFGWHLVQVTERSEAKA